MSKLEVVDLPADQLPGTALAVPLFEDQRPLDGPVAVVDWRLDGALTRMILNGELSGKIGDRLAVKANAKFASPWILVTGAGRWRTLDREGYAAAVGRLLKIAAKAGVEELALCLPPNEDVDASELERMVRTALVGTTRPSLCRLSRISRFS